MMQIAIAGCGGRMGKMLIEAVREHPECQLVTTSARHSALEEVHTYLQREGLHNIVLTDKVDTLVSSCDAVIDFTSPDYSIELAQACAQRQVTHICGTTGFSDEQESIISKAAREMTCVKATNFSVGVNLLVSLTRQVAGVLDASQYDAEIIELHHRFKKDAPSGTALTLGKAIADGRGGTQPPQQRHGRHGQVGERETGEVGFHAVRGGNIIGDHTVMFASSGERIELAHKSMDRRIYADGAITAALWAQGRNPGLYSMQDVVARQYN